MKRVIFVREVYDYVWSRFYPEDPEFKTHEIHTILLDKGNAGQMIQQMVEHTGVSFAGTYPDERWGTIYVFEG